MFKDVAIVKAFRKLFKYITGENEAGETMWVSLIMSESDEQDEMMRI